MDSLVSITLPVYNSHSTLPFALASLVAQSYKNWKAVIVDDGSEPPIRPIVEWFDDPRMMLIEHETNLGRPAARQAALERVDGSYMTMLDSDDWYYPNKLAKQVEIMESRRDLILLSAGMAITDMNGNMTGKRVLDSSSHFIVFPPQVSLKPLYLAHAPSIIRTEVLRDMRYNADLKRSQDADFLWKIIHRYPFAVLNEIVYTYSEFNGISARKTASAYFYRTVRLGQQFSNDPINALVQMVRSVVQGTLYYGFFKIGLGHWLIKSRSKAPAPRDLEVFQNARDRISQTLQSD